MTSKHFEISHEDYEAMQEEIERLRHTCKKQREALELCRKVDQILNSLNRLHSDVAIAKARKAVEECLK